MGIVLSVGLFGFGLYSLLSCYLVGPSLAARKALAASRTIKPKNTFERLIEPIALLLEKNLMLNEYKTEKLSLTLKTVGIEKTGGQFYSETLAESLLLSFLGLPLLPISPILGVLPVGLAVYNYRKAMKAPEKQLRVKREKIELELPKLASTIANSLSSSRDVIAILSSYRKVASPELGAELDITLAAMRTGTQEDALRRFEARIGSPKLSELVRGLLSVLQGEDQILYFRIKNEEFRREYIETQKRLIMQRPEKLRGATIIVVAVFFLLLFYVFGSVLLSSSKALF